MSIASSISGTVDEAVVFRQGVSVVTMPHQLQGMLPKMSAGTRARLVVSGNAPDSDVYFDDSRMGLGPGTITPDDPKIHPVYFFVEDQDKFIEQYDLEDQGIFKLTVTGSYTGLEDATYRIQIADPEDDDVYTLGQPTFDAVLAIGETESDHLNDLTIILDDLNETTSTGEEKLLIASSSYDASQGISTYKIEIASADEGSVDRVIWYKNGELLSDSADGEVINADSGNILEDGDNRIAVKFDYDGYEDYYHGTKQKHSAGDSWTIIAGAQQFKWKKGTFDDSNGIDFDPSEEMLIASGSGPIGIMPTSFGLQHLHEGIYIQLPSQVGYSDGSDPNVEQNTWEFNVTSKKVEAAITAMQEAQGKIEYLPDHRAEQRDFGQPKFHKDYDIATVEQQQIASVEIKNAADIGTIPYVGEDRQLYTSIDGKKINYSGADIGFSPDDLESLTMSTDAYGFILWTDGTDIFTLVDAFSDIAIDSSSETIISVLNKTTHEDTGVGYIDESDWASKNGYVASPLEEQLWVARYGFIPAVGNKSSDGKVGPYFTIYDLHPKCKTYRNNHVWFNFGNTTTDDITLYDDRDPKPQLSDPCMVDVSGRELVDITLGDSMDETVDALYEVYNVDVLHELAEDDTRRNDSTLGVDAVADAFGRGPNGWTNDEGATLLSAAAAGYIPDYPSDPDFPLVLDEMAQDSSGVEFWTNDEGNTLISSDSAGWSPDGTKTVTELVGGVPTLVTYDSMSVNISGSVILEVNTDGILVENPLNENEWMTHHGYIRWSLNENEWMTREGYKAVEDLLHGKHFTLYDQKFTGYFIWFDVDDKGVDVGSGTNAYSVGINNRPSIESSVYIHDPDETDDISVSIHKARGRYHEVRLRIQRTDKAADIATKLIERINRNIPTAWLSPYHHFCIGADLRDTYKAIPDDNDATVVQVELRQSGNVFEPDFGDVSVPQQAGPDLVINNDTPEAFQAYLRTYGTLAYNEYVLDDSITSEGIVGDPTSSKIVRKVGKFIKLYNSTDYYYPLEGTSHPSWVDDDHRYWSNDGGETIIQFELGNPFRFDIEPEPDICECIDGEWVVTEGEVIEPDWWLLSEEEWAALGNYLPYVLVDPFKPHIIWFNVDGISKNPADISDDGSTRYGDLWSYDVSNPDVADLYEAADNGRILEVRLSRRSIDRNVAYRIKTAINLSKQFQVPFMASTPGNQEILRIQQRNPGPILNDDGDQIDSFDECNSPVSYVVNLHGTQTELLDRDYVSDSMLFSFEDSSVIAQRFNASKRVVEHYATFDIKCVAEQKDGYIFDYSNVEEWVDTEGFSHPGGKVEKSNYEWGTELEGIPQAVNSGGALLWKTPLESDVRFTASDAGFIPNVDSGVGVYDQMSIDSRDRKIWIKNDPENIGDPLPGSLPLTAHSIGRTDEEMEEETVEGISDYIEYPLGEEDWMLLEEYEPVPAFSHIVSTSSYIFLPHPNKNYYIWFDIADISSDPGDDGRLDNVMGEADNTTLPITYADRTKIGGAIRVSVDSYDTAGIIAEKLVERINGTCYDIDKEFVRVGETDTDDDGVLDSYLYQGINAGNINNHFYAEISSDDSSIVRIYCRQPGLVSYSVLEENEEIADDKFPETTSGDKMTFTVIDDGDSEYFVDIESIVPGTIYPPEHDVGRPDADTGLDIEVSEEPYTPTQPGVTKVLAKFIPYEDMMSIDRGYLETQENGIEVAKSGPVAYIQDDIGTLMYPVIMANVSMKDPDQYDGVIEPLEIRSRASRNSPDGYFVAHEIKGMVMTEMAEDSRKRSNPITQFIEHPYMVKDKALGTMMIGNQFDPYEDGIEHMASSPAVSSFTRTPVFDGIGINDLAVTGSYRGTTGASAVTYYIKVSDVGSEDATGTIYFDKMKWKKDDEDWSDAIELDDTGYIEQEIILSFGNLGGEQAIPSLSSANPSGPDAMYSSTKELQIPDSAMSMELAIHCRGDINQQNEYYKVEWYNEATEEWIAIADYSNVGFNALLGDSIYDPGRGFSPNVEIGTGVVDGVIDVPVGEEWEDYTRLNDQYHPEYGTDSRNSYNVIPHATKDWNGSNDLDPAGSNYTTDKFSDYSKMKFRVMASAFVDADSPYKNSVKLIFTFKTKAAQLELDEGITAVFENSYGHSAGDIWYFEAIAKSHEDNVGSAVLPGYLTWQEAKISPFIESAEKEVDVLDINDPVRKKNVATGSLVFNYVDSHGSSDSYISTLNGQAFTLEDSSGLLSRFEFDNDGEVENGGEILVPLLRPESYCLRFPIFDTKIQKRSTGGRLLWTDGNHETPFTAEGKLESEMMGEHPLYSDGTYIAHNPIEDGAESDWVQEYGFTGVYTEPDDINPSLQSAADYAGTYFIITNQLEKPYQDETDEELAGILNTAIGRRYAVWFNVFEVDDDNNTIPLEASVAPNFDDLGRWTIDEGYSLLNAGTSSTIELGYGRDYTGYVPDTDTDGDGIPDKMGVTLAGDIIWTYDGISITTAVLAGYTGFFDEHVGDTTSECDPGDTVVSTWSEEEWAAANGYQRKPLTEEEWHTFAIACTMHPENRAYEVGDELQSSYSDFADMKPELVEVKIKSTDSSRRMISRLIRALRQHRNKNQTKTFRAKYVKPPEYEDLWDIAVESECHPVSSVWPDDVLPGNYPIGVSHSSSDLPFWHPDAITGAIAFSDPCDAWPVADYDPEKRVLIDDNWFNSYALDPNSPPNAVAFHEGWIPGYHSVKIESLNPGYHIVRDVTISYPLRPWEPGYENISLVGATLETFDCTADPGYQNPGSPDFILPCEDADSIDYYTYPDTKRAFYMESQSYSGYLWLSFDGGHKSLKELLIDTSDIINNSQLDLTSLVIYDAGSLGDPMPSGLFDHIFITGKTFLDDESYKFIDGRAGLLLYQNQPGEEGNTIVQFHHYNDELAGNIIPQNFENGYDAGPYISDAVVSMNMSTEKLMPNRHKSSAAGLVFENSPMGTDSLAFGGWKK